MCCVATFDSHWSCPVLFWPHRLPTARLLFALREPPNRRAKRRNDSPHAQAGGSGPVSPEDEGRSQKDRSRPGMPSSPHSNQPLGSLPLGLKGPCVQRPNATTSETAFAAHFRAPFGPSFCVPGLLQSGQTSPSSAPSTGWRSDQFRSPFGSDRRDPNTLAPNRSKARTTPLRPSRISASS